MILVQYSGLQLRCTSNDNCIDLIRTPLLSFWINGGTLGGLVRIQLRVFDILLNPIIIVNTTVGVWKQVTVNLTQIADKLTVANVVQFQDAGRTTASTIYLDSIILLSCNQTTTTTTTTKPIPNPSPVGSSGIQLEYNYFGLLLWFLLYLGAWSTGGEVKL